jgi:ferredoxin
MKAIADRDRCMAAGHCAVTAPAVFGNGDDGLVTLLDPEPGAEHTADVLLAEDLCPSRAIRIER